VVGVQKRFNRGSAWSSDHKGGTTNQEEVKKEKRAGGGIGTSTEDIPPDGGNDKLKTREDHASQKKHTQGGRLGQTVWQAWDEGWLLVRAKHQHKKKSGASNSVS